jgi:hypothetical protein
MKKVIRGVGFLIMTVSFTVAAGQAGFSGWRTITGISSHGPDGGYLISVTPNMDNSFCSYWNSGYVDPSKRSHKTILALATSAFLTGKQVQFYTQGCATVWGGDYTVFDRIMVK